MRGQGLFDKDWFNVLRDEGARRRDGSNIESGNIRARIPQQKTAAGMSTRLDNKITGDPGQKRQVGTGASIRAGIRADIEWDNK